jgi:hypothetical protein
VEETVRQRMAAKRESCKNRDAPAAETSRKNKIR